MRKITKMLLSLSLLGLCVSAEAQNYSFGLNRPLDEKLLPKSRVPMQEAVRVPKKNVAARLDKVSATEYEIAAGWELLEAYKVIESQISPLAENINTSGWYNAVVPGTVLTSLVENGVYPDPYWGVNNIAIPDTLCRMDWWYRVEFEAPRASGRHTRLVFDGINYKAEVWLNGKLLGNVKGAFTRGVFDVSKILKDNGKNVLAVRILPPDNPGITHEQNPHMLGNNGGLLCIDGPTFISSEGWDWVPGIRDRNIGIWQAVKLDYTGELFLGDSQIITDLDLPDTTKAGLVLKTEVKNASSVARNATLTFNVADVNVSKKVTVAANSTVPVVLSHEEMESMIMHNPKLWWPNGYGEQNLYTATVAVNVDGEVSDTREVRFGVRELEYELKIVEKHGEQHYVNFNPVAAYKDGEPVFDMVKKKVVYEAENVSAPRLFCDLPHPGIEPIEETAASPFIVIKVNGVKIFCRGGNWGMDDAMKNVSREHLEPYLKLHHDQNFNMIRNWTGESTETALYDLCDEYGILVFNDFWLSTQDYNIPAVDHRLFMANVDEVLRRHRNHPSIAIWSPRNEGVAPPELEKEISRSIAALDGTRHYIGSSIKINTTVSGPWTPEMPVTYYNPEINRGFNTEIGAPCVPTPESMRKMMAEEDIWPISDVWSYHTWLNGGWLSFGNWEKMVSDIYGEFKSYEDFSAKSQLFGFDVYRAIFEAAGSKLWNNTTGVLLWMSHPAWPSMAYETYTWDYETPGPYFGSMVGCRQLHVQMKLNDRKVQIINYTSKDYGKLTVSATVYDINGRRISSVSKSFNVPESTAVDCFVAEQVDTYPDVYMLRLELKNAKGKILDKNDYWLNGKECKDFRAFNNLGDASVKLVSCKKAGKGLYDVTLRNDSKVPAIGLKLNVKDPRSGASVLPAYFSDGYFTMLPKEKHVVRLEMPDGIVPECIAVEGYNLDSRKYNL